VHVHALQYHKQVATVLVAKGRIAAAFLRITLSINSTCRKPGRPRKTDKTQNIIRISEEFEEHRIDEAD